MSCRGVTRARGSDYASLFRACALKVACVCAVALLLSPMPSCAAVTSTGWTVDLPIFVTATLHGRSNDGNRQQRAITSFLAELQLRHDSSDWRFGPVVEVHRTINGRDDTTPGAGLIYRYYRPRWDLVALVLRQAPLHRSHSWNYGARVRYRVSRRGMLGAEAYGAVNAVASSDVWFGYYNDVSPRFSVRLLAGTNIEQRSTRLLRLDLVLQIR